MPLFPVTVFYNGLLHILNYICPQTHTPANSKKFLTNLPYKKKAEFFLASYATFIMRFKSKGGRI